MEHQYEMGGLDSERFNTKCILECQPSVGRKCKCAFSNGVQ